MKPEVKVSNITLAQQSLEAATAKYRAAQEAFKKAQATLELADDTYIKARVNFNQQVTLLKQATAVNPIEA